MTSYEKAMREFAGSLFETDSHSVTESTITDPAKSNYVAREGSIPSIKDSGRDELRNFVADLFDYPRPW